MDRILVTPKNGIPPFEVTGKLESKYYVGYDELIYYIDGKSFPESIVTILNKEDTE